MEAASMTMRRDPRTEPRPASEARELRVVTFRPEARAAGEPGDSLAFRGNAIVYDEWTQIGDRWFGDFMERIAPGAVAETIAADDIRLLVNHDPTLVLARRRGEVGDTLRLVDSPLALAVEADLAPTSYGRDIAVSLERGDVSGMSFAFEALGEEWGTRPDGIWTRTVTRARLYDVSVVTYPAYPQTDAALRSLLAATLPAFRAGRRNSAADETVIRSAIDALRDHADSLEALIAEARASDQTAPPADEAGSDRADEARRHSAIASRYGLGRAS